MSDKPTNFAEYQQQEQYKKDKAEEIFNKHSWAAIGAISPSKDFCLKAMDEYYHSRDAEVEKYDELIEDYSIMRHKYEASIATIAEQQSTIKELQDKLESRNKVIAVMMLEHEKYAKQKQQTINELLQGLERIKSLHVARIPYEIEQLLNKYKGEQPVSNREKGLEMLVVMLQKSLKEVLGLVGDRHYVEEERKIVATAKELVNK